MPGRTATLLFAVALTGFARSTPKRFTNRGEPNQAITREQAVIAYTLTAAYAEFAEKDKGSLEPGKFADLAVLPQDIFGVPPPELPKTESALDECRATLP